MLNWFKRPKKTETDPESLNQAGTGAEPLAEPAAKDSRDEAPRVDMPPDEVSAAEFATGPELDGTAEVAEAQVSSVSTDSAPEDSELSQAAAEATEGEPETAAKPKAEAKAGFWSKLKKHLSSSGKDETGSAPEAEEKPLEAVSVSEPDAAPEFPDNEPGLTAAPQPEEPAGPGVDSAETGAGRPEAEPQFKAVETAAEPGAEAADDTGEAVDADEAAAVADEEAAAGTPAKPIDQGEEPAAAGADAAAELESKEGFWKRLKTRLSATRGQLVGRMEDLLSSVREIDDDVLDELEEILITSDLGVSASQALLKKVKGKVDRQELKSPEALREAIRRLILEMITLPPMPLPAAEVKPKVIMVVGVNGVGKTTTIAKLARRYKEAGFSVLLAAGDTFRAAAVEQLAIWSRRLEVDIVSQPTGADSAAVVYDSLMAAQARKKEVVIIDTAGRLHTKTNLMDELKKIKRVAGKALPGAPHETLLVLDANTGQNALSQAKLFHEAVGVDSLALTKLDGTSKGGVIISICHELKLPVKYIGVGESFEDLRDFDPEDFSRALFDA